MKTNIYFRLRACALFTICIFGSIIIACQKEVIEVDTTQAAVPQPTPPDFELSLESDSCVIAIEQAPAFQALYGLFTISAIDPQSIFQCAAWATPAPTSTRFYTPCVLFNGPALLSPVTPVVTQVEVDCITGQDMTDQSLIIFVTCTDFTTGLSTTKSIETDSCST